MGGFIKGKRAPQDLRDSDLYWRNQISKSQRPGTLIASVRQKPYPSHKGLVFSVYFRQIAEERAFAMYQSTPFPGYQNAPPPSMRPPANSHPTPLSIPPQHQYSQYSLNSSPASTVLRQQSIMPPSPSDTSDRNGSEEEYFNLPGPKPTSHMWDRYIWSIEVVQHPQRARMCGFGDKVSCGRVLQTSY